MGIIVDFYPLWYPYPWHRVGHGSIFGDPSNSFHELMCPIHVQLSALATGKVYRPVLSLRMRLIFIVFRRKQAAVY